MKELTFDVTQQDIDDAKADRDANPMGFTPATECPISLALDREFGGEWCASHMYIRRDGMGSFVPTKKVRNFMLKFDTGKSVRPARFRIKPLGDIITWKLA